MTEESLIGWQKQPNSLNIQGEIENAIFELTGEKVELIGSRANRQGSLCSWTSCKF